jgi:predicted DNA-binding transcriptional regulator AlpA
VTPFWRNPVTDNDGSNDLLTAPEAAAFLRMSASALARWRGQPQAGPPFQRLGRRVIYRRSALDRWMDDGAPDRGEVGK